MSESLSSWLESHPLPLCLPFLLLFSFVLFPYSTCDSGAFSWQPHLFDFHLQRFIFQVGPPLPFSNEYDKWFFMLHVSYFSVLFFFVRSYWTNEVAQRSILSAMAGDVLASQSNWNGFDLDFKAVMHRMDDKLYWYWLELNRRKCLVAI